MAAALAKHVGLQGDITYSTNNGLIEIVPLGISKATGVEELARPQGITAEDVVAFGDMPNDVPMLRWAGLGVAMGNAHPEAWRRPTRSPRPTPTTAWRGCSNAGGFSWVS